MFTGIIEQTGIVREIQVDGSNRRFWIESPISPELKPDQSVSHNGVCLTVEEIRGNQHRVTAIRETLRKTNLDSWEAGTLVNIERCLKAGDRLDGHIVQGHVDCTATCTAKKEKKGSWEYEFRFPRRFAPLIIEKGSIAINGISLTAFDVRKQRFKVAIIPYTFDHTNIRVVEKDMPVNLEFDILGKYLLRKLSLSN